MGVGGREDPPLAVPVSETDRRRLSSRSATNEGSATGQANITVPPSPGPSTANRSPFSFPPPSSQNVVENSDGHQNLSFSPSFELANGGNLARSVSQQQQQNGGLLLSSTHSLPGHESRPARYLSNPSLVGENISATLGSRVNSDVDGVVSMNPQPARHVTSEDHDGRNRNNPRILVHSSSIQVSREPTFSLAPDRIANAIFNSGGSRWDINANQPASRPKYERMHSGRMSVYIPEEEVDSLPSRRPYRIRDMLLTLWAIGTYIFDYVMDWIVAAGFYRDKDYNWFALTVAFIVVPHLTMMGFSLAWYLQDEKNRASARRFTSRQWLLRMLVLILQLAPVLRYVDSLRYGYRFRNSEPVSRHDLYESLCFENADAAMLRLFEAFMEAAPQLVLQIYILVVKQRKDTDDFGLLEILQIVSIFSSWFSLATAMATFHRAQRFSQHGKGSMSLLGTLMQFGWHLFIFASRVIAIALFTARFKYWGLVACAMHVVVMIVWVFSMRTDFCPNRWLEYLYNTSVGCLYLFAFLNVKDTPTRWKYVFYYGLYYTENVILITLWFTYTRDDVPRMWFREPAMAAVIGGFWIGILCFMLPYYSLCHPDKGAWMRKRRYSTVTAPPAAAANKTEEATWLKSFQDFCL